VGQLYFKLTDFKYIPYLKNGKGYNDYEVISKNKKLLTETHCKQLDFPVRNNEKPIALKYISIKGKSGYVGLFDRTKQWGKIRILNISDLKIHDMTSEMYGLIGIKRYRKTMKPNGYIYDREKGYLKVFDVSKEKEFMKIQEKIESLKIKNVRLIKKPDDTIGAIEFFIDDNRYELTIDKRGYIKENGQIDWKYVPGVFLHDTCIFCQKEQRICYIMDLYKGRIFNNLIIHKDIRLHWIFDN
jgi:hypothetical protein